jgi:hypothetical protein
MSLLIICQGLNLKIYQNINEDLIIKELFFLNKMKILHKSLTEVFMKLLNIIFRLLLLVAMKCSILIVSDVLIWIL